MVMAMKDPAAPYNVFVIGLDTLVEGQLREMPHASLYNIIPLLSRDVVQRSVDYDMEALIDDANRALEAWPGQIHGIATCWDFPANLLAITLRSARSLPGPTLESALKCEHKYWSRLEQKKVLPGSVPRFQAVDPFAENPAGQIRLRYPFWLKPIKSYASHLGFRINGLHDLDHAIPLIRNGIGRLGRPFDHFLAQADLPTDVRGITGHHCIAEAIISKGRQCTLEGYVQHGNVEIYGIVDSVRDARHRSCFLRYEYPSNLPATIQARMIEAGTRVISAIGLDDCPFNIEFFYERSKHHIWLLEINARISRSHTPLFRMVDGVSHLKVMLDVSISRRVDIPHRAGEFKVAAKFMTRVFKDGVVEKSPAKEDLEAVQDMFPGSLVEIAVKPGQRLSRLMNQDAYSYEIADLFLGAQARSDLRRRYSRSMELLPFQFTDDE
jgi:hypothetical protein